jgi:hypothetical protein
VVEPGDSTTGGKVRVERRLLVDEAVGELEDRGECFRGHVQQRSCDPFGAVR